jgi:hypothetical protein
VDAVLVVFAGLAVVDLAGEHRYYAGLSGFSLMRVTLSFCNV